jgi:hypothetical protein
MMDSEELKLQKTAGLQRQSDHILHLTEGSEHNEAVQQQKQDPKISAKMKKKKQPKTKSATEAGENEETDLLKFLQTRSPEVKKEWSPQNKAYWWLDKNGCTKEDACL